MTGGGPVIVLKQAHISDSIYLARNSHKHSAVATEQPCSSTHLHLLQVYVCRSDYPSILALDQSQRCDGRHVAVSLREGGGKQKDGVTTIP